jgi:hypothetical protein
VRTRLGRTGPQLMTDGADVVVRPWSAGTHDPSNHPVDRAIMATRNAVLGLFGLDPVGDL